MEGGTAIALQFIDTPEVLTRTKIWTQLKPEINSYAVSNIYLLTKHWSKLLSPIVHSLQYCM